MYQGTLHLNWHCNEDYTYHLEVLTRLHMETSFDHTAQLTSAQLICKDPLSQLRCRP